MKNIYSSLILFLSLFATVGSLAQTCTGNLLHNTGFENGLSNWEGSGGALSNTAATGTRSVRLCQNTSLRQTLATTPGKNLTLLFKAAAEQTAESRILAYIKYLSPSWQPLVTEFREFAASPAFAQGTCSKLAPAGTAWVEIGFLKEKPGCVLVDDVCLTVAGSAPQPDLLLSNLTVSNPAVQNGQVLNYTFDLSNASSAPVPGNFSIKSYLSLDETLSPDDVQDGIVPTGNLGAGQQIAQVAGATTVPASLPAGNYFLILKVDADGQIAESNENNNLIVAASPVAVSAPGGGPVGGCEKQVGNGNIHCVQPAAAGSANIQVVFDNNNQRTRLTLTPAGQILATENLGPTPLLPNLRIVSNAVVKYNPDGSVLFTKPFTPALQNAVASFGPVAEFGGGFVLLGWKNAAPNPVYALDSLFAIRTDANLNLSAKKFLALGSGLPGSNGAYDLQAVSADRLAFFWYTGATPFIMLFRCVMDGGLDLKSQKTIASGVFAANGSLRPNICRGFTATDNTGFGFCKSGVCSRSTRTDGEFVADTLQPQSSYFLQENSQLGFGTRSQRWFAQTSDGGWLHGERILNGNLSQITNDTMVLRKFAASGTLLWTKYPRLAGIDLVNRLAEANGTIYFFKERYSGEISFITLDCLESPVPPPPSGCAGNLLQNAGFENGLANWEGSGGTLSNSAATGTRSVRLCQSTNLRQTLAATPGKTLTLLFKARSEQVAASQVLAYVKYLSASWQPLITEFYEYTATASFVQASVSKTAPAGTAWVEVGFIKEKPGCVLVDDVCLSDGGPAPSPCAPDQTAPALANCPQDITQSTATTSATVSWAAPTATDACPGAVTLTSNFQPGTSFPLGTTEVVYTAKDAANNTSTCRFKVVVTPQTAGGPDLKITLTADKTSVPQWGSVTFTVTAKNEGNAPFADAVVRVLLCTNNPNDVLEQLFISQNGLVYAGPAPTPSFGTYNQVTNTWTLKNLAPGQTAMLTLPLFTLGTGEKKVFANAIFLTPDDADSQPNSTMPANCVAAQDDEAVWTINTGQALKPGKTRSNDTEITLEKAANLKIFPNPAGESVFLNMEDLLGKEGAQVVIFDDKGWVVRMLHFPKVADPIVEIPLSDIQSGVYFVRFSAPNHRPRTAKLVVQHTF